MSFSTGWASVLLGIVFIGNGIQERVRHRQGRVPAGGSAPSSFLLLGLGIMLLGILSVLARRGPIPFWLYIAPILLAGAGLIRTFFELSERQRAQDAPAPRPRAPEPLTLWDRGWKVVSIALSILALIASLVEVGALFSTGTAVMLALVIIAIWIYLSYYKRKYGRPWGSGAKTT